MDEVPEAQIEAAERRPADHSHAGVDPAEGGLADHLRSAHGVEVPAGMSAATQEGLHDRVHAERHAADDG